MHLKYEKLDEIAITHKNNYTGNKSYLIINIYFFSKFSYTAIRSLLTKTSGARDIR